MKKAPSNVEDGKYKSRINNSIRNFAFALLCQAISLIMNFIVRTVFVRMLGSEYLGVNGLYANVLAVLSLAEMGFGSAMVYSMYKPLAERDEQKLRMLMNLYAKVYRYIGCIVALLGLALVPFLDYIIKDKPNIPYLTGIYLLFLMDSVFSYFFAYKRSVLNADQKAYICSQYHYIFVVICSVIQISVLLLIRSYIVYLIAKIISTVLENIFIARKVDRMYPYLQRRTNEKLPQEDLARIKKDVSALVLSRVSHVSLNGTDNIIISTIVGVKWVGFLSNYTLISGSVTMIISQIGSALTGSLGNYIAKEKQSDYYGMFRNLDFMNFWIYGFCTICLAALLNPFIELWLGKEYLLSTAVVVVFCINFLIEGLLQTLWTFRTTMGLFTQGKFRPLFAAVINIIVSVLLARYLGVLGVLLGTTVSRLFVNAWYDPYIIFKCGLHHSVRSYYFTYMKRILMLAAIYIMIRLFFHIVLKGVITPLSFILLMIATIITPNLVFLLCYYKTSEFQYFWTLLKERIGNLRVLLER